MQFVWLIRNTCLSTDYFCVVKNFFEDQKVNIKSKQMIEWMNEQTTGKMKKNDAHTTHTHTQTPKLQIIHDRGNPIWQEKLFNFIGLFYLWSISVLSLRFDYIPVYKFAIFRLFFPLNLNLRNHKIWAKFSVRKSLLEREEKKNWNENPYSTRSWNGILGSFLNYCHSFELFYGCSGFWNMVACVRCGAIHKNEQTQKDGKKIMCQTGIGVSFKWKIWHESSGSISTYTHTHILYSWLKFEWIKKNYGFNHMY